MSQDAHVKLNAVLPWKKQSSTRSRLFAENWIINLRKKLVKCCIWIIAVCGAVTWTLREVDQKYPVSSEMWCWRRMEKIIWIDRVGNEEVLLRVKGERNILHTVKRRKANWIGHFWRRNCLIEHVIEGEVEGRKEVMRR
jgi:hypothetical protein